MVDGKKRVPLMLSNRCVSSEMGTTPMKFLPLLILLIPLFASAGEGQGLHFERSLSWAQTLAKAKHQHKLIFVDAATTVCAPCKEFEEKTLSQQSIGAYYNQKFISVKVQMDQTPEDSADTRTWYGQARELAKRYVVKNDPTFLFFSPNGKLVNRGEGIPSAADFVLLGSDAIWFSKSSNDYFAGRVRSKELPTLAKLARQVGNADLAARASSDYILS
jgi:thioredoxin-related protein